MSASVRLIHRRITSRVRMGIVHSLSVLRGGHSVFRHPVLKILASDAALLGSPGHVSVRADERAVQVLLCEPVHADPARVLVGKIVDAAVRSLVSASRSSDGRSSGPITSPSVSACAPAIACASSLMFPGQSYPSSRANVSGDILQAAFPTRANRSRKWATRSGMSLLRSLSGGRWSWITRRRKYKVISKPPRCNPLLQFPVRRRDDPDAGRFPSVVADHPVFTFLNQPKQLTLKGFIELTHFIEKKRSTLCDPNQSGAGIRGAGKRPPYMPEQFAPSHLLSQHTAVHDYKWSVRTRAAVVDLPGDEFLPGPGLPGNQHGKFALARPARECPYGDERGMNTHHRVCTTAGTPRHFSRPCPPLLAGEGRTDLALGMSTNNAHAIRQRLVCKHRTGKQESAPDSSQALLKQRFEISVFRRDPAVHVPSGVYQGRHIVHGKAPQPHSHAFPVGNTPQFDCLLESTTNQEPDRLSTGVNPGAEAVAIHFLVQAGSRKAQLQCGSGDVPVVLVEYLRKIPFFDRLQKRSQGT